MKRIKYKEVELEWMGQSSFRIKRGRVLYIDPYKVKGEAADVILITHEHFDHCDPESIQRISRPGTVIIAAPGCSGKVSGRTLAPGQNISVSGIKIEAVHAYNINKNFHPKGEGVGFIVEIAGVKIYHAGDTDRIPEMRDLKEKGIDIALLPVGGTYTMNAFEAADAANEIKAKLSIPMHFGKIVGSEEDARVFENLVNGDVRILDE